MSYARTAVTRMTLDMSRPDLQRSETVTLGDTNRRWEVTLINGGAPFRLPPNWTAALTGIKPDGTGLLNGCSVVDGKIIYDFAAGAEIATCAGNYPVQFDIWDEVGDLVASPKIYVNVLADVRPRAELESNGQYTQIGALIGRVNQTDEDVDLLAKNVLAQGTDITALKKKVTTSGSVTIPASEWTDTLPKLAYPEQPVLANGMVGLLMPHDYASQTAARKAKIKVQPTVTGSGNVVIQREDGETPTGNITLDYIIIKVDDSEAPPRAALIGVDAYGEDGGGVDEDAVKEIINSLLGNVDNERQYSAANPPPYPVTSVNGHGGPVNLNASDVGARPSNWTPTAADVKADPVGTAESKTADLRDEINSQLATYDKSSTVNNKISEHNVSTAAHEDIRLLIGELRNEINKFLNVDDSTRDELSEVLDLIDANAGSIESITVSKVNVRDIVDDLVTNRSDKPLSAAQGVALKLLIDNLDATVEGKVTVEQLSAAVEQALASAKESGDFDGRRGYAILRVTTSTTSASGTGDTGAAIKYKIALSTVCAEAGVDEVLVGDTVLRAYVYMYPVVKVDASYVYLGAYTSIKGNPGAAGDDGKTAYQYAQDGGYTGTEAEFAEKLAQDWLPKNQGTANAGKILMVGPDGLITLGDMPEGGSGIGYVDANNNIIITAELPDGTYSVKYETADGLVDIGKLELGAVEDPEEPTARLPEEYQEVEWVQIINEEQVDSNSCITTGLNWSEVDKVVVKLQHVNTNNTRDISISSWGGVGAARSAPYIGTRPDTSPDLMGWQSGLTNYSVTPSVSATSSDAHEITATFSSTSELEIAVGGWSDATHSHPHKWYKMQFYKGETLLADYVPCYRKADNVNGFYDVVRGTFNVNAENQTSANPQLKYFQHRGPDV